ncbi:MAG: prepilin-type N-terminal cleavage/methylation domain-containing protein [Methylococcaceae bacterium]|nr:prepilin-type N-terminal cleavage/methylation domain-containing protein [Methylococcaceae bacterium]
MTRSFPGKRRDSEAGITLLEILVAFSIMAVILGVLLQIFGKGLNLADTGERYSRAVLLAESLLATVGQIRKIEAGEESGEAEDLYEWSIDIQPYEDPDLGPAIQTAQFPLYSVLVSVRWENRSVVLQTLRFGPPV